MMGVLVVRYAALQIVKRNNYIYAMGAKYLYSVRRNVKIMHGRRGGIESFV